MKRKRKKELKIGVGTIIEYEPNRTMFFGTSDPCTIDYSTVSDPNDFPAVQIYFSRRLTWQDVKPNLMSFLTIMKDYLLGNARFFLQNLDSVTGSATSINGSTDKRVLLSPDTSMVDLEKWVASTNMTSSDSSTTKKVKCRSSGTKRYSGKAKKRKYAPRSSDKQN